MYRVLLVDDEPEQSQELEIGLRIKLGPDWSFDIANSPEEAIELIKKSEIGWNIAILDLILRKERTTKQLGKDDFDHFDGIIVAKALREKFHENPLVVCTASKPATSEGFKSKLFETIPNSGLVYKIQDDVDDCDDYVERVFKTINELMKDRKSS